MHLTVEIKHPFFALGLLSGKYIFLEASVPHKAGESAVLASSLIEAGKATCVQFWYHMKGKDIGSLKVYIQTNESRTLVWKRTGEQGNNWNFGQVGHKEDFSSYKVRLPLLLKCFNISLFIYSVIYCASYEIKMRTSY